ncbi:hypothetical protein ACMATS_35315 [Streptoverticillium reticulum]|uniref:hypothetical protein n=1 Tax=Streptoverticillium reticulum TaxID=1433415 RepID=UPI0039BF7AA0
MTQDGVTVWETAVLDGGPADGLRIRVTDRPGVVQVTRPCAVENPPAAGPAVQVAAIYVYRRDLRVTAEPLRYGFDAVSP